MSGELWSLGPRTLFAKEVRRFLRVSGQTLLSPAVTTALYLVVFGYALGGRGQLRAGGVPYVDFIVPGLIMLSLITNAFLNSASSLMGMKITGTLVDLLVTPLTHTQIASTMIAAAALRGLLVGGMTWLVAILFSGHLTLAHPLYALAFPILAAITFGAVGLLTGLWAEKFEQLNVVPSFILTPLTFLGGVFYDVNSLPPVLAAISHVNPILFLVEGMRYGMVGRSAIDPNLGLLALTLGAALLFATCVALLRAGWRLRQ